MMRLNRLLSRLAPVRLRYLLLVTIILGLVFFSLTYLGIRKARQSLLNIIVDEGTALAESLTLSSNNAIQAGLLLESLADQKLIGIAETAARQLAGRTDPEEFRRFRDENSLISIDYLNDDFSVSGSDRWAAGFVPEYPAKVAAELHDIRTMGGEYRSVLVPTGDTLMPLKQYFIYAVAADGNLVVLGADAAYIDQIMQEIGIGYLIQKISGQTGIEYILLQGREGIIFSSRELPPMLKIENDPFLDSLMHADTIGWRIRPFEGENVLEIARKFESVRYPAGVYRIGLNLTEFRAISRGYDHQIIIVAVILFILTFLVVAVVSINQNYFILDRSYQRIRSMTETIFERLSSAVLAYDADGKIIALNGALTLLTGLDSSHIGRSIHEVSGNLPLELPERPASGERLISLERTIVAPSGERRTILAGMSSLPADAGGGTVILIHDITEQKRLEEENRRRERLSEMGDMAAGVAHEIRNPLNAIGIAAQRLKMEFEPKEESDEYGRLTKNILDETVRLNEILTRFLDLARARAMEDRPIDVGEAISRSVSSLSDEARRVGVEIAYLPHDPVTVRGSVEKYQQVFINLIKNGIQAMPGGGKVTITVDSASERVVVSVTDTGPGFPPDVMSKIFQPYFTTKASGSGLGLALAYKIVTDYGGHIEAANLPSGGASIRITLPRA